MVRKLLIRGLLAGLLAGLFGFGIAKTIGQTSVDKAIAFGGYVENNIHHEAPETSFVSRSLQSSAGLGTGALIYGIALGGITALVFAGIYGRGGLTKAKPAAALVCFLGFVGVYLAPVLKYPANPPSIGQADTIGRRTALFVLMIACSIVGLVVAGVVWRQLLDRTSRWNATVLAALTYVVVLIVVYVVFPGVNEVPQAAIPGVTGAVTDATVTFPPAVLWQFRIASLAIQAVLWATIALAFGFLAERLLEPKRPPVETTREFDLTATGA